MTTAREENARTLAAAIGATEAEADRLLDSAVLVTTPPGGERLAGYVRALLARTLTHVLSAPEPNITPAVEVVIGGASPRSDAPTIGVGVHGWRIEVRDGHGAGLGGQARPIIELLAACYASAAAVHRAIGPALPVAVRMPIAVDLAELYGTNVGRLDESFDLGSCFLAGAGAIGNAVILGLSVLDVRGDVHVCDPDAASDGNLNRCWWFDRDDLGEPKAERLVHRAQPAVPGLRLIPHPMTLRAALEGTGVSAPATLIIGVDSRRARRNLQNEMPQRVFDASTTGITEVVLYSNVASSGLACLSCIYYEAPDETAHERHVAEALGVAVAEVRANFVSSAAAHAIAKKYTSLVPAKLEGLAYDSLFKELCGKGELKTGTTERVLAPFAFVSVLAGVMLAIEIAVRAIPASYSPKYYNYWRLSPWAAPVNRARELRQQRRGCEFCGNETLQSVVKQIWVIMSPKGPSTVPSAAPLEIDPKELEALSKRLLAFARRYASVMTWWLGRAGALAKGYTVEDVVCKALVSLYGEIEIEGVGAARKRAWDREKYPEPWVYLMLFVKTELRNLSVSSENKLCGRDLDEDSLLTDETPEALLLEAEADSGRATRVTRMYPHLVDEISDDDLLQKLHDLIVNEGIRKPAILAARMSISVKEVNNLKRKLSRICTRILARLERGEIK